MLCSRRVLAGKGSAVQRKHDIRGAGIACRAAIVTAALLLFGCSYKSEVPIPTAAATATPARAVSRPTSVYLAPEIAVLARDAKVDSDFCRAFDFPVEIGPRSRAPCARKTRPRFHVRAVGGSASRAAEGARDHIVITLESSEPSLWFQSEGGFSLGSTAVSSGAAKVAISLQVRRFGADDAETSRTSVSGVAHNPWVKESGNYMVCDDFARLLTKTSADAILVLASSYREKIFRSRRRGLERNGRDAMLARTERVSVYQPEQEGREFPQVPVFATSADERDHRKRRLVAACRAFAAHGLDYGFAGHLTVRDPEFPDLDLDQPASRNFPSSKQPLPLIGDLA